MSCVMFVQKFYLGDGRVGRPRSNEGYSGGGGVVGHHGLLDLLLHIGNVPEGPHRAHALQHHHGHTHVTLNFVIEARTLL